MKETELLVHAISKRKWQVVERPIVVPPAPIPMTEITVLVTLTSEKEALLWAKGRRSATKQPISTSNG